MENKPTDAPSAPRIDPMNYYTGEVSVIALLHNWTHGHDLTFPHNMGEVRTKCHECGGTGRVDGQFASRKCPECWGHGVHSFDPSTARVVPPGDIHPFATKEQGD